LIERPDGEHEAVPERAENEVQGERGSIGIELSPRDRRLNG
jgi:hypothetical protein